MDVGAGRGLPVVERPLWVDELTNAEDEDVEKELLHCRVCAPRSLIHEYVLLDEGRCLWTRKRGARPGTQLTTQMRSAVAADALHRAERRSTPQHPSYTRTSSLHLTNTWLGEGKDGARWSPSSADWA